MNPNQAGMTNLSHPPLLCTSLIPITLICGPPKAGKSTYLKKHAGSHDMIIDVDQIASSISGRGTHLWADDFLRQALVIRNQLLSQLSHPSNYPKAWMIVGEPSGEKRNWWKQKLGAEIIVMATPEAVCLARAAADPRGTHIKNAIKNWWRVYTPQQGEITI